MIKDYKKYEVIENAGLGTCHILDKCDNGYLVYSENNVEHFIVCDAIFTDGYLSRAEYRSSLESALSTFNDLKKDSKVLL